MGTLVSFVDYLIVLILGAGVFGLVGLIGVVRLVNLVAAVQSGRYIAAGIDDGAVLILMLARRHLTVAVAVVLDRSVILAVLWLGGFLRSSLIMTSSEHASKRPAAGHPFGGDRRLAEKEVDVMLNQKHL